MLVAVPPLAEERAFAPGIALSQEDANAYGWEK